MKHRSAGHKGTTANRKRIGSCVKKWRLQNRLSLRGLSEKTGIPHPTINNIEVGRGILTVEQLEVFSSVLGQGLRHDLAATYPNTNKKGVSA